MPGRSSRFQRAGPTRLPDNFLLHLLLAFLLGGAGVGGATLAARRFHSGLGGLIGGLPTVSSVSFFFIALNQSTDAAVQATVAFPLGLAFTQAFLLIYALLAGKGFRMAMAVSFSVWFILSTAEAIAHVRNIIFSSLVVAPMFLISLFVLKQKLKLTYVKGPGGDFSITQFLKFALPGGSIVAAAVFTSQLLGPNAGGVAAAFPAIFSLTLTFTYLSEGGMPLSRSMTKPLMISAMTVAFPYSIIVGSLYPVLGLYLGTLAALFAITPFVLIAYVLIHRMKL
jgi:hypothetical protein